ncbi:MAG TPA: hypothetical protein P5533_01370 [Candidatus Cloacimonadota bacterium]|nr:hypothetical protein [Candidatus Cloacimonadota bacterium]
MNENLNRISQQPFDYQHLKSRLKDYRYPRNKISKLLAAGDLIALKSGLYVLSEAYNKPVQPEVIANLLYGPSYLSLDYALSFYNLIPEHTFQLSSVTTGRCKLYRTRLGVFSYQQLKPSYYNQAYRIHKTGQSSYLIASPEKALCDKLYLHPRLSDLKSMDQLMVEDLRLEFDVVATLNRDLIDQLAQTSGSGNLRLLQKWMAANEF